MSSRATKPSGSSRSADVGNRSGWLQTASRPSAPRASRTAAHRFAASRIRRGRSSRPTSVAKVASAGPPVARVRRTVSASAAAAGIHGRGRLADDVVDPALDQGEHRLQALQGGQLLGGLLRLEQAALELGGELREVLRVDPADRLLQRGGVDRDAAGVLLDQGEHLLAQPAGGREQALPRALAQRQVERDVGRGLVETLTELGDVGGQQGHVTGLVERQSDVGHPDHLGGQLSQALAQLQPEHARPGGAQHRSQHLLHPGQAGDGLGLLAVAELRGHPPSRRRCGVATGSTSRFQTGIVFSIHSARLQADTTGADPGEVRRGIQPDLRDGRGLADLVLLPEAGAGIGTQGGDGLPRGVLGHLPVHAGVGRRWSAGRTASHHRPAWRRRSAAGTSAGSCRRRRTGS